MGAVISVDDLRKVYAGVPVVDGLSFEVRQGEIFGLLGPNGAGKTTTVECLQGLRSSDGGSVTVLGLDPWRESSQLRRRIGSQLQESGLPDRIKVWEALSFFARPGTNPSRLLDEWGLTAKRNTAYANLSGGQRQRLFVALALINEPELVFLDEMTTGLDPSARHVAWELIEQIRARGTTVVLVTHFMDEAQRLCDRIAIVKRGKVVASGTPEQLIAANAGEVTVRFSATESLPWLNQVAHVKTVHQEDGHYAISGEGPVLAHVGAALLAHGQEPADLEVQRQSLEDVYLRLTDETRERE